MYCRSISIHPVSLHFERSAAGGSSGDGSVDVKMLAEQNVQLKEALKRLHSHSIAEKTDVSALVWPRVLARSQHVSGTCILPPEFYGGAAFPFDERPHDLPLEFYGTRWRPTPTHAYHTLVENYVLTGRGNSEYESSATVLFLFC